MGTVLDNDRLTTPPPSFPFPATYFERNETNLRTCRSNLHPSAYSPGRSFRSHAANFARCLMTSLHHGSPTPRYMTEIANGCPLGDYGTASQVAHMTATSPLGPWTRKGIALKGFAHNPQAIMVTSSSFVVYINLECTGAHTDAALNHCGLQMAAAACCRPCMLTRAAMMTSHIFRPQTVR